MDKLLKTVQAEPLAVATIVSGGYLALGRWKNIQDGQGCPKCEYTQMLVAAGLVLFAGYTLFQSYRGE